MEPQGLTTNKVGVVGRVCDGSLFFFVLGGCGAHQGQTHTHLPRHRHGLLLPRDKDRKMNGSDDTPLLAPLSPKSEVPALTIDDCDD